MTGPHSTQYLLYKRGGFHHTKSMCFYDVTPTAGLAFAKANRKLYATACKDLRLEFLATTKPFGEVVVALVKVGRELRVICVTLVSGKVSGINGHVWRQPIFFAKIWATSNRSIKVAKPNIFGYLDNRSEAIELVIEFNSVDLILSLESWKVML
ncbi:hypothetical protein TWF694_004754 [Orbilia ellipsospora]|uniref:Uncharacterized protein n=1 Tax=Orbilia ellipsospora TaxID=2528407 RepID=A0AAV9X278_9PEZI